MRASRPGERRPRAHARRPPRASPPPRPPARPPTRYRRCRPAPGRARAARSRRPSERGPSARGHSARGRSARSPSARAPASLCRRRAGPAPPWRAGTAWTPPGEHRGLRGLLRSGLGVRDDVGRLRLVVLGVTLGVGVGLVFGVRLVLGVDRSSHSLGVVRLDIVVLELQVRVRVHVRRGVVVAVRRNRWQRARVPRPLSPAGGGPPGRSLARSRPWRTGAAGPRVRCAGPPAPCAWRAACAPA